MTQSPEEIAIETAKAIAMLQHVERWPDGTVMTARPDDYRKYLPRARRIVREVMG